MNAETLARATFVLSKDASDDLAYLSGRMGRSRSSLVREMLEPSVREMAALVRRIPDSPTAQDAETFRQELRSLLVATYDAGLDLLEETKRG